MFRLFLFLAFCTTAFAGEAPSFRQDVLPLLTKAGCNAGGCHGKLAGQNGFKLSLRGFAAEWDYDWITKDVNGRRVNYAFPEQSLLVEKASGGVVHEGGTRFRAGSREWQMLVDWIAARAPGSPADEADAERLEIADGPRTLKPGGTQQLVVKARYADGRERDVTWLAQFFSNDEAVVKVKPNGAVKAVGHGEGTVRVHFQTLVAIARFTMPFENDVAGADFASARNALDAPIFKKLAELRIPPSPQADDRAFVRRAFLDAIGTLPTAAEVEAFAADAAPDKRERLADALLARPEWLDFWTLQLADILQNRRERDHDMRGAKGVRSFHSWLRGQLADGKSWADIAGGILLAKGDAVSQPAVGYFTTVIGEKERVEESELPDSVAQSFLGTRIGCARCHNHPLERYTQDDFYHFAAFFGKVSMKRVKPESGATELELKTRDEREAEKRYDEARTKLAEIAAPEFASAKKPPEEVAKQSEERAKKVSDAAKQIAEQRAKPPEAFQPRTNARLAPQTLDRAPWKAEPGRDAREQFVEWMLGSEQFSGAMVNRVWKHFFGTGLVESVDDLRPSNPPSNGELWTLLNAEFRKANFDLKHITRLILASRAYALSSQTQPGNETETRFYSHYYARRLPAEVLSDAIATATGVPVKYDGYPLGLRAIQLPDPQAGSYFLGLFGRSDRVTACACERKGEVTLPQLLHLHNGDEMQRQIVADDGRLAALLKEQPDDRTATDALFTLAMQRKATDAEFSAVQKQLAATLPDQRAAALADLFWALLNAKEFAFNH